MYPSQMEQEYGCGTHVIQSPIGSNAFVKDHVKRQAASVETLMGKISDIEDMNVFLTLLRNCTNVRKMNYLFRVVPPHLTASGAKRLDAQMENCVKNIAGGVLEHDVFLELGLPI